MPLITASQLATLGDLAPNYNWDITITGSGAGANIKDLNLLCVSTDIPKATNTPISVQLHGFKISQPGIAQNSDSITLTTVETVTSAVETQIREWRNSCWHPMTGYAKPSNDVKNIIILNKLDRQKKAYWQYTLYGAWMSDYEFGSSLESGETGEIFRPTLTITYDYFLDKKLA